VGKFTNITDIAKLSGVSRSTVSRVLTNSKNVKHETAQRVKKAIKALNYRPNILARGLATGKLNIIALLMSETESPFYMQMFDRLDLEIRKRGYILSICYLGRGEAERCENFRIIQEYGFSGFIMGDIKNEPSFIREVMAIRRPLVFFNRYVDTLMDFDAIIVDNYLGGYLAGKHLIALGHRRIAMLTGPLKSSASHDRYRGFRDALAEKGIQIPPNMLGEGELSLATGTAFANKFFPANRGGCTAIFAGNDIMAIGILNYCRERGIGVPEDLSLVGFDDMAYASSALINLTTVQQPYVQMSAITAERIVARINGDGMSRQRVILEPRIIIRKTTAPVGDAK
jgi:LacI family transcriptional regulator